MSKAVTKSINSINIYYFNGQHTVRRSMTVNVGAVIN